MDDLSGRIGPYLELYGAPSASLAALLCDGHPPGDVAFRLVEPDLSCRELTYGELRQQSERFSAALAELGIGPGDRVATLMGKSAEYVVASMAIWRLGAVQVPLFTALTDHPHDRPLRVPSRCCKRRYWPWGGARYSALTFCMSVGM